MKYIKQFNTESEYNSFKNSLEYVEPNLSLIKNTPEVKFNRRDPILTFKAGEANSTVALVKNGSPDNISLEYSTDGGATWNAYIIGNTITLTNIGDNVKFKGINYKFSTSASKYYNFQMTGKIAASGDVTSLLNGVGRDCRFNYGYVFYSLFANCTSLVTAPELPSKLLTTYCYSFMFSGCTSLVIAPELPAKSLAISCYNYMFQNCSNLNYIKAMFTTSPTVTYTRYWVSGVKATGTFVKNLAAKWTSRGVNGVPTGWTVRTDKQFIESLAIFVDDFPDDLCYDPYNSYQEFLDEYVEDPEYFGSNMYRYTGETFIYDGDEYYLWKMIDTKNMYDVSSWSDSVAYMLTETIDYDTLNQNSMYYDTSNRYIVGVTFLNEDMECYTPGPFNGGVLVRVYNDCRTSIYIDEFPETDPQWYNKFGNFKTMEHYLDSYLNNLKLYGANKYDLTSETFSYDGDTYYVWSNDKFYTNTSDSTQYVITDTANYTALYNRSIESDYENYRDKFIILLGDDMTVYRKDCDALIKIE